MFFWRKKSDEEKRRDEARKQAEEVQKRSIEELSRGGIPILARERLEKQSSMGSKFFSSDLTAREYLLTKEAGITTIGQVMGTCFYNISLVGMIRSGALRTTSGEMVELSKARLDARRLAVNRMQQEAKLLGASGVIGVRVQTGARSWSGQMVEFTAIGTAVRIPNWPDSEPFVCDLNGQEFWQLYNAGFKPSGIAFGICSYYIRQDNATRMMMTNWWGGNNAQNQELPIYTQGFYDARHEAMARLSRDITDQIADGVVGVEVDYDVDHYHYEINNQRWHDMLIHFVAMGTAITKDERIPVNAGKLKPLMVMNLSVNPIKSGGFSRMEELGPTNNEQFEDYDDDFDDDD